jgi:CDP-paratose 2-epimerase
MSTVVITGACGLIGSECVKFFHEKGFAIIGIDDNSRAKFFGEEASTIDMKESLLSMYEHYTHYSINIKDYDALVSTLKDIQNIELVIHTAAQPSHDWAATNPFEDFNTNALGTLNLLELVRNYFPNSVFILTSTNKVYGDRPNYYDFIETKTRYTPKDQNIAVNGINENMSIDNCKHSLFGVSKSYADLITQEYGKYFGIKTGVFRGGCLTGSNHSGVKAHGFLSYLIKCANTGQKYYINGYKGKQVRDNIHSYDVATAFYEFYKNPTIGEVYNIGGGEYSNCSILEAIEIIYSISNKKVDYEILEKPREGDHIWYISDMQKFKTQYPNWKQKYNINDIIKQMLL